ncbi:MAG: hypothetical protein EHM42_03640, partial [Planctomycetaceae bacterium]
MIEFTFPRLPVGMVSHATRLAITALALSASACGTVPARQARHVPAGESARQVVTGAARTAQSGVARGQSSASAVTTAIGGGTTSPYHIQPVSADVRLQIGPRGECPHGCPSIDQCPSCPSSCCDPEDQYPDEYLCDGGD